eukprot:10879201-Alexandrium_andersonii.AAC.1
MSDSRSARACPSNSEAAASFPEPFILGARCSMLGARLSTRVLYAETFGTVFQSHACTSEPLPKP